MTHDDWLDDVETIVWRVSADDPDLHREIARPGGDDERDSVSQFAVTRGLLLQVVIDGDEVDDMPYVMWFIEVPATLHERRDRTAIPPRLADVITHLRERYAAFENWSAEIDEDQTTRQFFEGVLHNEYADLIHAIEIALLPLRTQDAARHDAMVRFIGVDGPIMLGTYHVYLTAQEDHTWLLVHAGIADATAVAADNQAAHHARRYGLRPDQPILVLPRPDDPLFFVEIHRGAHQGITEILEKRPEHMPDIAADLRWVSRSPQQLADAVRAAAPAWWPHASPPPAP